MRGWYRHAVLAGQLEHYCLLCEETFSCSRQVERHIRWPEHRARRDALLATASSPAPADHCRQLTQQRVHKINDLFYCEACNTALESKEDALLHADDATHARRLREYTRACEVTCPLTCDISHHTDRSEERQAEEGRRVAGGVVLFRELYCGQRAWNGICGGSCVVCNVAVEDATSHCGHRAHRLRLLCSRVRRDATHSLLYRQISEWFFQCVTCNKVLPESLWSAHRDEAQHAAMHERCRLLARHALSAEHAAEDAKPAGHAVYAFTQARERGKLVRRHTFAADKRPPYVRKCNEFTHLGTPSRHMLD